MSKGNYEMHTEDKRCTLRSMARTAYLNRVPNEVASVGCLQEPLLAGRDKPRGDGVPHHLVHKLHTLVSLFQGLHVAYHAPVLSLATCRDTQLSSQPLQQLDQVALFKPMQSCLATGLGNSRSPDRATPDPLDE